MSNTQLVKVMQHAFPNSTHIFCMLHCKDDMHHCVLKIGFRLCDGKKNSALANPGPARKWPMEQREISNSFESTNIYMRVLMSLLVLLIAALVCQYNVSRFATDFE